MPLSLWVSLPLVVAIGFFLPGYALSRRWPTPTPWVTSFLGSCVLQFYAVLALDVSGLQLTRFNLAVTLAILVLAIRVVVRGHAPTPIAYEAAPVARRDWLWLVPTCFGVASIAAQAVFDPL